MKQTSKARQSSISQSEGQPLTMEAKANVWEIVRLLGKWTRSSKTWYLVKWNGFDDQYNSWEKQHADLIEEFEAGYQGIDVAIKRLLKRRTRRGRSEYLVQWDGRRCGNT